ncbi:MAG: diaminopimelate epimerase, partial [Micrococcales bacterium]|nr:diaminopimelate epimerase [Micrococcales bacterium]
MSSSDAIQPLRVVKGHGTRNDFVLLDGRDGLDSRSGPDLTPALARALADRRGGVGGDGVIRLVESARIAEGAACL